MEKVKILKPTEAEFDIVNSACTIDNLILNFDSSKYTIESLLDTFREATSVDLFNDVFPDRPFGEYHYLKFFNVTEFNSGSIEVRMTIISGEEREALELQDRISELKETQEDQDEAILDIGEAVFS